MDSGYLAAGRAVEPEIGRQTVADCVYRILSRFLLYDRLLSLNCYRLLCRYRGRRGVSVRTSVRSHDDVCSDSAAGHYGCRNFHCLVTGFYGLDGIVSGGQVVVDEHTVPAGRCSLPAWNQSKSGIGDRLSCGCVGDDAGEGYVHSALEEYPFGDVFVAGFQSKVYVVLVLIVAVVVIVSYDKGIAFE